MSEVGFAQLAKDRRHVDDTSGSPLYHPRQHRLAEVENPFDVDRYDAVELGLAHGQERSEAAHACIVDEDPNRSEGPRDVVDDPLRLPVACDVQGKRLTSATGGLNPSARLTSAVAVDVGKPQR